MYLCRFVYLRRLLRRHNNVTVVGEYVNVFRVDSFENVSEIAGGRILGLSAPNYLVCAKLAEKSLYARSAGDLDDGVFLSYWKESK